VKTTAQKLVEILENNGIKVRSIWVENAHNQKKGRLCVSMEIKIKEKKEAANA